MGTSTSHPSPNRPAWHSLQRALANPDVPINRLVNELWTVALRDSDAPLADELSSDVVYQLASLTTNPYSTTEALRKATDIIVQSKRNSVVVELAKRALVSSFHTPGDRVRSFATNLFIEVSSYLISRDIPSWIGLGERLTTVSAAIRLKNEITFLIRGKTEQFPVTLDSVETWRRYVTRVTHTLSGGRA